MVKYSNDFKLTEERRSLNRKECVNNMCRKNTTKYIIKKLRNFLE